MWTGKNGNSKVKAALLGTTSFLLSCRGWGEDPGGLPWAAQPLCTRLPPAGHGPVGRKAGPHRQAAAQDEGWGPQGPDLLADGALPGHPGGLPHSAKVATACCSRPTHHHSHPITSAHSGQSRARCVHFQLMSLQKPMHCVKMTVGG